jgi:hypothetical protein
MAQQQKKIEEKPIKPFYLHFEPVKEQWNRYKLSDGSILKSKFILISLLGDTDFEQKLLKSTKESPVGVQLQSQNVVGVEAPENNRGAPDKKNYSIEELEASVIELDLDTETISETWNSYNVEGKISLKIKSSPIRVRKTDKFDNQGIPIYMYNFALDIKVNPIR